MPSASSQLKKIDLDWVIASYVRQLSQCHTSTYVACLFVFPPFFVNCYQRYHNRLHGVLSWLPTRIHMSRNPYTNNRARYELLFVPRVDWPKQLSSPSSSGRGCLYRCVLPEGKIEEIRRRRILSHEQGFHQRCA